jgi:hypothetical protein
MAEIRTAMRVEKAAKKSTTPGKLDPAPEPTLKSLMVAAAADWLY